MIRPHTRYAWLWVAGLAACADTGPVLRSARAQQHTAVVLAYLDVLHNRHDPAQAAHLYLAPAYVDHGPAAPPAEHVAVLRSVSQGDLVAVQLAVSHADGARESVHEIYRLYQGHIVDRWAVAAPEAGAENSVAPAPAPVR